MTTKQERLKEVYEHLRAHFGIHTQIDFAEAIRITRPALSSAMNGNEAYLTKNLFQKICGAFPGVFDMDYLLTGEGQLLTIDEEIKSKEIEKQNNEIPEYVQRLFEESARMTTRNEMLERQCEKLISELRCSKDNNEKFLSELRKSKEYNDTLVAELKISRVQNDNLISELRETKKHNAILVTKLESAIDGIEGMKNQLAMMVGAYATPQPPIFSPLSVNDDPVMLEGLIRGEHQAFTEEYAKSANKALDSQPMKV